MSKQDRSLGQAFRVIREATGNNQREFAAALSITNVHVCNIERGHSTPSRFLVDQIEETWGMNVDLVTWFIDNTLDGHEARTWDFRKAYFEEFGIEQ